MYHLYQSLVAAYPGALLRKYVENQFDPKLGANFVDEFYIDIPYKDGIIKIVNEYGHTNVGYITYCMNKSVDINFHITSIDHFTALFSRNKNRLKIKAHNPYWEHLLSQICERSGLYQLAKELSFDPEIQLRKDAHQTFIDTRYSLLMTDKIAPLRALITFYQLLIDEIP